MKELISLLKNTTASENLSFKTQFFRLNQPEDLTAFENLLERRPFLSDEIDEQLKDLIKSRNPSVIFTEADYAVAISKHLNGCDRSEYGAWVYYPWSHRLVHLLDEKEFIEVRTNRNKYKITDEEEAVLATKIVGVCGLSVGQTVAVTLAMERAIGELRVADFDLLELTNLNRIRTGVQNMGVFKAIIVAREIAEIDPYLKVVPFTDGLTEENMDRFFTEGGNLDVIIDECDGLDIKILLRHKAKAMKIPVLMEMNDRCTFDVERFDLEPDRPLLHGYIDHLDHTKIGSLTNDEKIPFLLPMLGIDTISKKLKASMAEVAQTITTWPQLSSAVALGGAVCADVCRRIMLDQFHESGRYFIDIDELIADEGQGMEGTYDYVEHDIPELNLAEMDGDVSKLHNAEDKIEQTTLKEIATAGALAPSSSNNQPWKWLAKNGHLYLFHDKKKSESWFDTHNFISQIAFGSALENAIIKADNIGYTSHYELYPLGEENSLVAALDFEANTGAQSARNKELGKYIEQRCTNRKNGKGEAINADILTELSGYATEFEGASLSFLTDITSITEIGDLVPASERIRFMHPQSHHEFFSRELKWNDSGEEIIHDGLDIKTYELPLREEVGLKVASDPGVIALLNKWGGGKAFEKLARKTINTSAGIGLITMPSFSAENFINGGRLLERVWLACTKYNVALQPISAPIFLHTKIMQDALHGLSETSTYEIKDIYKKLTDLYPDLQGRQGIFLFRLSKADEPTARSLRYPIEQIYTAI